MGREPRRLGCGTPQPNPRWNIQLMLYDGTGQVWSQVGVLTNVTSGYIRWRTSALAYRNAVVVDNLSNDGTFIPGAEYAQ